MIYFILISCVIVTLYVMWKLWNIDYLSVGWLKFIMVLFLFPPFYLFIDVVTDIYVIEKMGYELVESGTFFIVFVLMYLFWIISFLMNKFVTNYSKFGAKQGSNRIKSLVGFQTTAFTGFRFVILLMFLIIQFIHIVRFINFNSDNALADMIANW